MPTTALGSFASFSWSSSGSSPVIPRPGAALPRPSSRPASPARCYRMAKHESKLGGGAEAVKEIGVATASFTVDDELVYWAAQPEGPGLKPDTLSMPGGNDPSKVPVMPKNGGAFIELFPAWRALSIGSVAVEASCLYWTMRDEAGGYRVMGAPKDGSDLAIIAPLRDEFSHVIADGNGVYWTDWRDGSNLDAGEIERLAAHCLDGGAGGPAFVPPP